MKADTCRYYNGAINPNNNGCCEAGVNYRELVGGDDFGWVRRTPCSKVFRDEATVVSCPRFQLPTPEEVAESKRKTDESMRKFMVAFTGKVREWREANAWSQKNPKGATGKVPCEACGTGEIHLSMSAYNGHVHGQCTTDGCVSWME